MSEKYTFKGIVFTPLGVFNTGDFHQALFSRPATRGIRKLLGLQQTVKVTGDNLGILAKSLENNTSRFHEAYDRNSVLEAVAALKDFHRRKETAEISRSYGA